MDNIQGERPPTDTTEAPPAPVRRSAPLRGVRHTRATRKAVIAEFKRVGRVDLACAAAGCDRDSHYRWLKDFPDYAEEFKEAQAQAIGLLEDEAHRRAYSGTIKPVSIGGKMVFVTEFSDRLVEFLLKARAPEKYGDRRELTHKGDLTVKRIIGVADEDI